MSEDLAAAYLAMFDHSEEARQEYVKMPWGWPGNKALELDHILPHLPYGKGYGEPFGGSGVVLQNRRFSKLEVFNDRYSGVTDILRVVRDPKLLPLFLERVHYTLHSREEFIWSKNTWKNCDDPVERAARFYYCVRFAVNSKPTSTFGRATGFGASFSSTLHNALPLFGAIHSRFINVTLENLDWRRVFEDFDQPGFVWYVDPTYLDCSVGNYEFELSREDHRELVERVSKLEGFAAVSTYDGPLTRSIYDKAGIWTDRIEWTRKTKGLPQAFLDSNNMIHKETSNDRHEVRELLWIREPD